MNELIEVLSNCILFKNVDINHITEILNNPKNKIKCFSKEQCIAIEGDDCTNIGVVLSGALEAQKIHGNGKTITIDTLTFGDVFGEVIIFSKMNKYPLSFVASTLSKVIFIPKSTVIELCSGNSIILNNFMGVLSNKILMLNKKIKNLSFQTIRQKISSYILELHEKQNSNMVVLPHSRKEMSEQLGVQRPSLSRELINMREEGILDFDKNTIKIIDIDALEEYLYI